MAATSVSTANLRLAVAFRRTLPPTQSGHATSYECQASLGEHRPEGDEYSQPPECTNANKHPASEEKLCVAINTPSFQGKPYRSQYKWSRKHDAGNQKCRTVLRPVPNGRRPHQEGYSAAEGNRDKSARCADDSAHMPNVIKAANRRRKLADSS